MSWPCFLNLLHLIKPDPIFYNQSQNPQQDVSIKLVVSTSRLGSNSNGASFQNQESIPKWIWNNQTVHYMIHQSILVDLVIFDTP
ncbi:hypothetical protein VP01_257g3 [Puccinia sorghi]|uniref:Uncharacterized protein n=1 Tax=Puccinia sorghi TaxID=27349 RepID=A0A0L6V6P0_9BASI|nr:hypothetical protein VP01_257g3 [Puccinia sorghi]